MNEIDRGFRSRATSNGKSTRGYLAPESDAVRDAAGAAFAALDNYAQLLPGDSAVDKSAVEGARTQMHAALAVLQETSSTSTIDLHDKLSVFLRVDEMLPASDPCWQACARAFLLDACRLAGAVQMQQ